jgi:hypothetical protein
MIAPTPVRLLSWPQLVALQFMLTLRNRRWMDLIGGAAALQAVSLLIATVADRMTPYNRVSGGRTRYRVSAIQEMDVGLWMTVLVLLAAMWAAFLWRDEAPSQRRYHWSLPADHGFHDLARVAAGAIWVVILAVLVIVTVTTWLPYGGSLVMDVPWFLFSLLVAYGLGSIAALSTERPLLWILGSIILAAGAMALLEMVHLRDEFEWLYEGRSAKWLWPTVAVLGLAYVSQRRAGAPRLILRRV